MHNPTLKKIAEMLGVSVSTVSRALKNHPDISEATRLKVAELAQILDYEPNASAVHLRTKNSKLLGLLVPSIFNFFYESFISAIEEEGRKNGYSIMILQSGNDPDMELNNLKLFRQNRITGLFACISPLTEDLFGFDKMKELDIPVIFFDKVPDKEGIHKVCLADEQAAIIAAEAIIRKKKKNLLALFGDTHMSITQKRLRAFSKYFADQAPTIQISIAHTLSSEEARLVTREYLAKNPTPDTIFCMSDEILIGTTKALQEMHITYPDKISLIAISNGFIPTLFYPEITYVETSGKKLGKLAFAQMMERIGGDDSKTELSVEAVLMEGGSI